MTEFIGIILLLISLLCLVGFAIGFIMRSFRITHWFGLAFILFLSLGFTFLFKYSLFPTLR